MNRWTRQLILVNTMLLVTSGAVFARAQQQSAVADEEPRLIQKVLKVEHVNVNRLRPLLQIFEVEIVADAELKVIAVKGRPESVAALEASLERLDVPPPPAKNIALTVYLVNAKEDSAGASDIPSEISDVVDQIKSIFPYKSFHLWETIPFRTRDDQNSAGEEPNWVQGMLADDVTGISGMEYEFGFMAARVIPNGEGRQVVRLDTLRLEIVGPVRTVTSEEGQKTERRRIASIRTDIDVREGQKVVVGKANIGASEGALFLVVMARVE
jgi:hypothetical protein